MRTNYIDNDLLERYLTNRCDEAEKKLVEQWYADIKGISNFLDTLSEDKRLQIKNETFDYIKNTLGLGEISPKPIQLAKWVAILAAASIILIIGIFSTYKGKVYIRDKYSMVKEKFIEKESNIVFTNSGPQIVQHNLPDGTKIWLHHEATVTYPAQFLENFRLITLNGEAFFDVAPDKTKPFIIQSGKMQIKVLGTSFNVKAKSSENIYKISVVTGLVRVSSISNENAKTGILLKPSEQALYEPQTERITFVGTPVHFKKEIFEPIDIVFDDTSLADVIKKLESRFNVNIHLLNIKLKHCGITADFEQQPLLTILDMLCTSLGANYTMSDQTILLDGPSCD